MKKFFAEFAEAARQTLLYFELVLHDLAQETTKYSRLRAIVMEDYCPIRPSVQHWWTTDDIHDGLGAFVTKITYCRKCGLTEREL